MGLIMNTTVYYNMIDFVYGTVRCCAAVPCGAKHHRRISTQCEGCEHCFNVESAPCAWNTIRSRL